MAKKVYAYALRLPDIQALDPAELVTAVERLRNTLRAPHWRLIVDVNLLDADKFEDERTAQVEQLATWFGREYGLEESRAIGTALRASADNPEGVAWRVRPYVVSFGQPLAGLESWGWAVPGVPPNAMTGLDEAAGDDGGEPVLYQDDVECLAVSGSLPYPFIKIMASFAFRPAQWSPYRPWLDMLVRADGAMMLGLDAVQVSEERLRRARKALENTAALGNDPEAASKSREALAAIEAQVPMYEMRLIVLLRDVDRQRLLKRAIKLAQRYDAVIGLDPLRGQQAQYLAYFTLEAKPKTPGPRAHSSNLLDGAAIGALGLAGLHNDPRPRGIYLGFRFGLVGGQGLGPAYFDGWRNPDGTDSRKAYHMCLIGATGGGKSVATMALLARERAYSGVSICWVEPMRNARKLAGLLQNDPGMSLHELAWDSVQVNPLDPIGAGAAEQTSHFLALLQTMLDMPLDTAQQYLVATALREVYAGVRTEEMVQDPRRVPRLSDFVRILRELSDERLLGEDLVAEQRALASDLANRLMIFVADAGYGSIFNRPTNLVFDFNRGAALYDLFKVSTQGQGGNERFKTILYYVIFTRYFRDRRLAKEAGDTTRSIFALDEYGVLSGNPYVKALVEEAIRTARNLGTAVWIQEQNLATLAGLTASTSASTQAGGQVTQGLSALLGNVRNWVFFNAQDREAAMVRAEFASRLPANYAAWLPFAATGRPDQGAQSAVLLDREALLLQWDLLPSERLHLLGEDKEYEDARPAQWVPRVPVGVAWPTAPARAHQAAEYEEASYA